MNIKKLFVIVLLLSFTLTPTISHAAPFPDYTHNEVNGDISIVLEGVSGTYYYDYYGISINGLPRVTSYIYFAENSFVKEYTRSSKIVLSSPYGPNAQWRLECTITYNTHDSDEYQTEVLYSAPRRYYPEKNVCEGCGTVYDINYEWQNHSNCK